MLNIAHKLAEVVVAQVAREPLHLLGRLVDVVRHPDLVLVAQLLAGLPQRLGDAAEALGGGVLLVADA